MNWKLHMQRLVAFISLLLAMTIGFTVVPSVAAQAYGLGTQPATTLKAVDWSFPVEGCTAAPGGIGVRYFSKVCMTIHGTGLKVNSVFISRQKSVPDFQVCNYRAIAYVVPPGERPQGVWNSGSVKHGCSYGGAYFTANINRTFPKDNTRFCITWYEPAAPDGITVCKMLKKHPW